MRSDRRVPVGSVVALVAAVVSVVAFALAGVLGRSGPSTQPFAAAPRVVIVSIPGLQWRDLDGTDTPNLDALLSARGVLSVRTASPMTTVVDGYLTLSAGNRLSIDLDATDVRTIPDGPCVDPEVLEEARAAADDQLGGAVPGALGAALAAAGVSTSVHGSPAALLALADTDGCVGEYREHDPGGAGAQGAGAGGDVAPAAGVELVELAGLETAGSAAERAGALREIEARLAPLRASGGTAVFVLAPAAPGGASEVTVAGVRDAAAQTGLLSSGTTRRAPYVTVADVAPTVLAVLGLEVPGSMNGTEIRRTSADDEERSDATFAALADRIAFRDRAVGPVAVVFVVLISLCGLLALARRGRIARMLAPIVAAYPSVTFLAGMVDLHELPLDFVAVAIPVASVLVGAVATASWSRWGRWAPTTALLSLLWFLLVVDIATGGQLQINTVLGYTPTIAGRFQGYGNLASALAAASALVVAVVPLMVRDPGAPAPQRPTVARRSELLWMGWVGAITLVAVGAPAFGSDVGGTLTLVPVVAILALVATGRRVRVRTIALAGALGVAVVSALAAVDLSRAASSRTHLGRFADDVLHGDGWTIVRRKLRGNLAILTSSFWTFVLLGVFIAAAVYAWRWRAHLRTITVGRPALRIFPTGFVLIGLLGLLTNDSGIAIPGIMLGVGVPWLVSIVFPPNVRAGR